MKIIPNNKQRVLAVIGVLFIVIINNGTWLTFSSAKKLYDALDLFKDLENRDEILSYGSLLYKSADLGIGGFLSGLSSFLSLKTTFISSSTIATLSFIALVLSCKNYFDSPMMFYTSWFLSAAMVNPLLSIPNSVILSMGGGNMATIIFGIVAEFGKYVPNIILCLANALQNHQQTELSLCVQTIVILLVVLKSVIVLHSLYSFNEITMPPNEEEAQIEMITTYGSDNIDAAEGLKAPEEEVSTWYAICDEPWQVLFMTIMSSMTVAMVYQWIGEETYNNIELNFGREGNDYFEKWSAIVGCLIALPACHVIDKAGINGAIVYTIITCVSMALTFQTNKPLLVFAYLYTSMNAATVCCIGMNYIYSNAKRPDKVIMFYSSIPLVFGGVYPSMISISLKFLGISHFQDYVIGTLMQWIFIVLILIQCLLFFLLKHKFK